MRAWYGAETEGFKTPPPPNKCAVDEFHNVPMRSVKVLTDDMANRVVERIKKEDVLYITIWECNDHRFDPDGVGVVGFMAARWDESFFIFPMLHSLPAKMVGDAVKGKKLACTNVARATHLFGRGFQFVDLSSKPTYKRKVTDFSTMAEFCRANGIVHCNRHFANPSLFPLEVSDSFLRHAASELYWLARFGTKS